MKSDKSSHKTRVMAWAYNETLITHRKKYFFTITTFATTLRIAVHVLKLSHITYRKSTKDRHRA